ncbi:peptidase C12, ubiquitin carboxyl-terminal hydrolase, partial [Pavlovales sp. CCMP2436]
WIPLESSPEVFNDFARRVGVGAGYAFTDVLGLDAELLAMLPQPCVAVLLLFPVSRELARSESARVRALGGWDVRRRSPRVFFMKQYVGNACGTVAAMHALVNNRD